MPRKMGALPVLFCLLALQEPGAPVPLVDLGQGTYLGCEGGLYPGGANTPPETHLAAALALARSVQPLNPDGLPDPERGLIGLLAIGPSPAVHVFGRFERLQDENPLRHPRLIVVNGAQAGEVARVVADPQATYWKLVANRLAALGLAAEQVQVVWLQQLGSRTPEGRAAAGASPAEGLPEARVLHDDLGSIVRILRDSFPNLRLCYLSDRAFGGYASERSAEPRVYETGFAVKWLIEDQIAGSPELNWDPALGPARAPLLLWGPYLWARGEEPNALGAHWLLEDYEQGSVAHPSAAGEQKVATLLGGFFARDPTARPWFANPGATSQLAIDAEADAHVEAARPDDPLGTETRLVSKGGAEPAVTFLRFDLSGVRLPVLHAKLSLRNPEDYASYLKREVFAVSARAWEESTLTYPDAPALASSLGLIPKTSRDGTRSLDVTAAVNACDAATLTLALAAPRGVAAASPVLSRESGEAPRLVLIEGPAEREGGRTLGERVGACPATLRVQGQASATAPAGFLLRARGVDAGRFGFFTYGAGTPGRDPWGPRASLAPRAAHARRVAPAHGGADCDGFLDLDLNARWCAACPEASRNPGAGATAWAGLWFRGPGVEGAAPSRAIAFTVVQ